MNSSSFLYTLLALCGVAVVVLLYCRVHRALRNRPLSATLQREVEVVQKLTVAPAGVDEKNDFVLSFAEAWSIYSDSRRHLVRAHRLALRVASRECHIYAESEEDTHRQLVTSLCRAILLQSALYTRAALWLYIQEQAIMNELKDCWREAIASNRR